ncbi:MAG: 3-deoxy-7-phosphoheptulonate synthase [Oscillospiraceae bacterium]|nr:3-deoxy-7-phosphoheptulonate synthase [Oscillospiraceae bacterium]
MSMNFRVKLPIPMELKKQFPLNAEAAKVKAQKDEEIRKIFTGEDNRFVLVIGPCSADNPDAVYDYLGRLKRVQEQVADKILLIPRIYTNKPRTNGTGYKGILHQPDPEKEEDMLAGIIAIRQLHMNAVKNYGMPTADEMLYPENYRYLDDILSYVAVGARSTENQQHRLTASGMDVPAGMKNPTAGDLGVMMNSIYAAQAKQTFIYRGWEVHTDGNPLAHAILRGYVNKNGVSLPNYHYEDLALVCDMYQQKGLQNPAVIVDCNHNNSGKKFKEQIRIANEVMHSRRHNEDICRVVKGLMIESYLEEGSQKIGEGVYGKSITDPCLGWCDSENLILSLADQIE